MATGSIIHLMFSALLFFGLFMIMRGSQTDDWRMGGGVLVMALAIFMHDPVTDAFVEKDDFVEKLVDMEFETRYSKAPIFSMEMAAKERIEKDIRNNFSALINEAPTAAGPKEM